MGASDSVERHWSVSNRVTANQYPYYGPLGGISRSGRCFFAWKEGFLIGTYRTFDEARESLVWRARPRPLATATALFVGLELLSRPYRGKTRGAAMRPNSATMR